MLRAGMPKKTVLDLLKGLAAEQENLRQKPWELRSVANSLSMPAAAGSPFKSLLEPGRFQALWNDPANVWPDLLASVQNQGEAGVMQLQFDVCSQLLDFLISDNRPENLAKANTLLKKVFGSATAPTEAQLLLIFHRDLDQKAMPDWPTLKLAIQVHRLAEQIALAGGPAQTSFPPANWSFPGFARRCPRPISIACAAKICSSAPSRATGRRRKTYSHRRSSNIRRLAIKRARFGRR